LIVEAEKTDKTFRVVRLEAENVKRLRAVAFDPAKHAVIIGGANSSGKSSLLDSLFYALGGGRALPEMPIRAGEERATIRVDLGGLTVERVIKPGGATLVVRNAEGDALQSPQKILDRMVGALTFDPLDFVRADVKGQVKQLEGVLGTNVAALDAERKRAFDQRTEVNREVTRQRAALGAEPVVPAGGRDTEALLAELRTFDAATEGVKAADVEAGRTRWEADAMAMRVRELEAEIAQLQAKLGEARVKADRLREVAEQKQMAVAAAQVPLRGRRTVVEIQGEIRAANEVVRLRDAHAAWVASRAALAQAEATSGDLTVQLAAMDAAREAKVAAAVANVGLAGLGLDERGVTWGGIPLVQCSSAEQLRVAVGLGFAANPQIRIVLLREGALLDDTSLAAVIAMAEQADAQVWIEVVGDRGPGAVIIEDGAIREVPHGG
jgi:alpha-D-ribose 1-methylphosphonate 5-triphosphate synthase subunit PhnL